MNNSFKLLAAAIVSVGLLSGCVAQTPITPTGSAVPEIGADRAASKWFVKDTSVCFFNLNQTGAVNVFFGTQMYPLDYYMNGNMTSPAGRGGPVALVRSMGWVCTDTRTADTWDVPGSVDVLTTVTFPNGRKTTFGFANPSMSAPKFYPANEIAGQGPGAGQSYDIPEETTYSCSILEYDFTVKRRADDDYKNWAVEFGGETEITDYFDDQVCQP